MKKILIKSASTAPVSELMKLFMRCNLAKGILTSKELVDQLIHEGNQIYDIADEYYTEFVSGLESLEVECETFD